MNYEILKAVNEIKQLKARKVRRHLKKGHQTVKSQNVIVVMTCSIKEQIRKFTYINSMNMVMMMKKENDKAKAKPNSRSVKRKKDFCLT